VRQPPTPTPPTYKQAISCPDSESWKTGIGEEVDSLLLAKVFEFTDELPTGKKALRFKWVFKRKIDTATGLTSRFKARFTAMGNRQVYGQDYWETLRIIYSRTSIPLNRCLTSLLYPFDRY
jgi:hypothetical protein